MAIKKQQQTLQMRLMLPLFNPDFTHFSDIIPSSALASEAYTGIFNFYFLANIILSTVCYFKPVSIYYV